MIRGEKEEREKSKTNRGENNVAIFKVGRNRQWNVRHRKI